MGFKGSERYRKVRLLGEGGAGRVWLVRDRLEGGRQVALKELGGTGAEDESLRGEFALLRTLRHPNLVEVHEFHAGRGSVAPHFTLEYVDGEDILRATAEEGLAKLPSWIAEVLRALAFLHDFGLIHRDLKPSNLLIRRVPHQGCRLVVLDFGLALRAGEASAPPAGTLPYMAPELLQGGTPGRRSDLYAVGAVVHEAIHGRPPVEIGGGGTARILAREPSAETPPPLSGAPEELVRGLTRWVEELVATSPDRRPATAAEALARLNRACSTDFTAETALTRAARLASGPPPGRETELRTLWQALDDRRRPGVVLLTGDAGSGKSRILRWLSAEAARRGWEVSGDVAHALGGGSEGVGEFLEARRARAAERRPVLLLLDELEAASPTTVSLVERVAREPGEAPLKVVAALRRQEVHDESLARMVGDVGAVPTLREVRLGPLDGTAIGRVVARTGGRASEAQLDWLERASGGNALLLETLLVEGVWEKGGRPRSHPRIDDSVRHRLRALSAAARAWIRAVCVSGAGAAEWSVKELSALAGDAAEVAARETVLHGLAVRRDGVWSPASRSVGRVVLAELAPEGLRELCARAAALEGPSGEPGRLARLWRGAGDAERSVRAATAAAERDAESGRFAEAAEWYGFALRQLSRRDPRRRRFRERQAELFLESGQHRQAIHALGTVLRLAQGEPDRAAVLAKKAVALAQDGRFKMALEVAEEAIVTAQDLDVPSVLAQASRAKGIALFRMRGYERAMHLFSESEKKFQEVGDAKSRAKAVYMAGVCASRLGNSEAARMFLQRAIELSKPVGDPGLVASCWVSLGNLERRTWRIDEALKAFSAARGIIESKRLHSHRITHLTGEAVALVEAGAYDKALDDLGEAEPIADHLGSREWRLVCKLYRAAVLIQVGRPSEAAELLDSAVLALDSNLEPSLGGYVRATLAEALLEEMNPDFERAFGLIREVLEGSNVERKAKLGALLVEMERRVALGGESFDEIHERFGREIASDPSGLDPPMEARAELALARARLGAGAPEAAEQAARKAIETAEAKGLPALGARAWAVVAEASRIRSRATDAAEAMRQARRLLAVAARRIEEPNLREDFLNRSVFRAIRESGLGRASADEERLIALYEMIRALNSETDPDLLLESMLDMALEVVRAERGMVLLLDSALGEYTVRVARNLEKETIRDAAEFSRSIVLAAGRGRPVLAVDTRQNPDLAAMKSVALFGIRSVLCVPLRLRDSAIGAVYLDNRVEEAVFDGDDLRFLEAFADHAALALENATARTRLEQENRRLRVAAESRDRLGDLIGRSTPMQRVYDLIGKVAATGLPVLIVGESGTGKELVARAIHERSLRRHAAFVVENCAALPEGLLESELFGHVRGAFTGADRDRTGLFEEADGGTLFLDEVGDMPPAMQVRLLRVLEEGEVRRVGGQKRIKVDVRLLAATHRRLQEEVAAGRFRDDLFYRLQVLVIELPPLRERPDDIPLLVDHFLRRIGKARGRPPARMRSDVLALLERHPWPGNVRQLENHVQRLVLLAGEEPITLDTVTSDGGLRQTLLQHPEEAARSLYSLARNEREQIERALTAAEGNRARAARILGISRATMFRKIKEYGLS